MTHAFRFGSCGTTCLAPLSLEDVHVPRATPSVQQLRFPAFPTFMPLCLPTPQQNCSTCYPVTRSGNAKTLPAHHQHTHSPRRGAVFALEAVSCISGSSQQPVEQSRGAVISFYEHQQAGRTTVLRRCRCPEHVGRRDRWGGCRGGYPGGRGWKG